MLLVRAQVSERIGLLKKTTVMWLISRQAVEKVERMDGAECTYAECGAASVHVEAVQRRERALRAVTRAAQQRGPATRAVRRPSIADETRQDDNQRFTSVWDESTEPRRERALRETQEKQLAAR